LQLIESFICGKENNPRTCEDGLFISERYVAVIDGVTAKGNRLWNNKTSGAFAKDVLSTVYRRSLSTTTQQTNITHSQP